jgi:hypothetical protein
VLTARRSEAAIKRDEAASTSAGWGRRDQPADLFRSSTMKILLEETAYYDL